MIKTSKHNISNISNQGKLTSLDDIFVMFKNDVKTYINYIIDGNLPLKINLSSKLLPTENIKHSKWKRETYKEASAIIRSQIKKANNKRYKKYKNIYYYMSKNHPDSLFVKTKFSDLKLNNILYTKYFTLPNINKVNINLTNEFFDIKDGNHFDKFLSLKTPFFNDKGTRALKIKLPFKLHKHSNKLSNNGYKLRNNIQLQQINGNYFINLIWEKEDINIKEGDNVLGIDLGYKKLITTSRGEFIGKNLEDLYIKISETKRNTNKYKRLLIERDNLTNKEVNKLDLSEVSTLIIEDLVNLKHKSELYKKVNNRIQYWSYRKTINKLESICMEKGIKLVKVSPAYTSQTCSSCGNINKDSRKLEEFRCISCGYEDDADVNASINIRNMGVYSLRNDKRVLII
jgi:IS605 OrfB family transposase